MDRLTAAQDMVVTDTELSVGEPVIRATRIPGFDVPAFVAADVPIDRIFASLPPLETDKVGWTAVDARAVPAQGNPQSGDGRA